MSRIYGLSSPWACSKCFKDRFVLSLFDEDFVTGLVRARDRERVVVAHAPKELWTDTIKAIFWMTLFLQMK